MRAGAWSAGLPCVRACSGLLVAVLAGGDGRGARGRGGCGSGRPGGEAGEGVGAENLCHQAIFVNHAPGAIAPLDPELIRIRDAVGQLP